MSVATPSCSAQLTTNLTEDVESWPQWSPTVDSVARIDSGTFDVGSIARIKQPGLPEANWTVTELTRGRRFAWETHIRGIRMKATHELTASEGGTRNVLRFEMSGAIALFLWPIIRNPARRALERENAGLKATCERLNSP